MESKNIFSELALSCFSLESYNAIKNNGFGKRLLYHLLLTIVLFAISICIPYGRFVAETGGVQGILEKYVPDFQVVDGELYLEKPVNISDDDYFFVVDDTCYFEYYEGVFYKYDEALGQMQEYVDVDRYESVILADYEKLIMYSSDEGYRELYFSDIADMFGDFNRQSVVDFCNGFVPVVGIIIFIGVFIGILWNSFISAIILLIISKIQNRELPFIQLYTIALYARTPFSIIFAILGALSIIVPFKSIIIFAAVGVYTAFILKNLSFESTEPVISINYGDNGYNINNDSNNVVNKENNIHNDSDNGNM